MEGLEARTMLAGNVTAEVVGGVLRITGDARGNEIRIEDGPGASQSSYRVMGVRTEVNGEDFIELDGAVNGVRIDLGAGNDRLNISGNYMRVTVEMGRGNDSIYSADLLSNNPLTIRTGAGRDVVSLVAAAANNGALIETGTGQDFVGLFRGSYGPRLRVRTGSGPDTIFHQDITGNTPRRVVLGGGEDVVSSDSIVKRYDFRQGSRGWRAGFADFFTGREQEQQLESGIRNAPASIGGGRAFFISGENSTDDLFMFLRRQIGIGDGLKPNTEYQLFYEIEFGSNAQEGCSGIGGAPAESVFMKAGASTERPRTSADEEGIERLNVDHGQQAQGGSAATVLGHVGNGEACEGNATYRTQTRSGLHTALVKTDSQGRMHLIVGTDSGFEGTTALYYKKIRVQLVEASVQRMSGGGQWGLG
jgi:hypothetical protein